MDDLAGRTFLVTGGNTGIGYATATQLARRGGRVFIACRSAGKAASAIDSITAVTGNKSVSYLPLDLSDLTSVHRCAEQFIALGEPLHVLINNAGVAGSRGLTREGFELTFGVNHVGHFALTMALLDTLKASTPARVVTVASDAHYQAKGIDYEAVRKPTATVVGLREYAVSKLANVAFTQELARRLDGGVTAYALHPGVVASDIWRRVPWPIRPIMKSRMISNEEGARTSVFCATAQEVAGDSGRFYDKCRERRPSKSATPELAAELWERSIAWTSAPSPS